MKASLPASPRPCGHAGSAAVLAACSIKWVCEPRAEPKSNVVGVECARGTLPCRCGVFSGVFIITTFATTWVGAVQSCVCDPLDEWLFIPDG